jgi:hypothetical protein
MSKTSKNIMTETNKLLQEISDKISQLIDQTKPVTTAPQEIETPKPLEVPLTLMAPAIIKKKTKQESKT